MSRRHSAINGVDPSLELLFHSKLSDLIGKDEISGKLPTGGRNHSIQIVAGKKGLNFKSINSGNNFIWSDLGLIVNSDFSISYWVYASNNPSNHGNSYFMAATSSNQGSQIARIASNHASHRQYANTSFYSQPYYFKTVYPATKTIINEWKLVTITFKGDIWVGYQNGVAVHTSNDKSYPIPDLLKIYLSYGSSEKPLPTEFFRELKIFKGVLTPTQILDEHKKGLSYE